MLRIHRSMLLIAFSIGCVYVSHHLFLAYTVHSNHEIYYPVTLEERGDDAIYYIPRAKQAYNDLHGMGDISLVEYRNAPSFLPMLNPLLLAVFGILTGSFAMGLIVSDFLLPFCICIGVYVLARSIVSSTKTAYVCSIVFTLAPMLFLALPPLSLSSVRDALGGMSYSASLPHTALLYFSRAEYPKMTFLFFLLAYFFIFKTLTSSRRIYQWAAGIFLGTLFYTYLFDWATCVSSLGICVLFLLLQKRYQEAKRIGVVMLCASFLSIPYWLNMVALHALPSYHDITVRLDIEEGRRILWSPFWKTYVRNIVLSAAVYWIYRKNNPMVGVFLGSWLLSYIPVTNAQLLLGFTVQSDHWYRVQFLPIALAWTVCFFWVYQHYTSPHRWMQRVVKGVCVALCVVLLLGKTHAQYRFSRDHSSWFTLSSADAQSYDWLNTHTPPHTVVGSISPDTQIALLLHTHNRIFLPAGFNTVASNDELWKRSAITARMYGMSPQAYKDFVLREQVYLFTNSSMDTSQGNAFRGMDTSRFDALVDVQTDIYTTQGTSSSIDVPYRLDYILFGPKERQIGSDPILTTPSLKKVYEKNGINIYQR